MRVHGTKLGAISTGRGLGDQLYDLAGQLPGLDLNFARNKSLIDDYSGTTLVTFTRASSGTFVDSAGVLQTAATDEPRFDHNPTTGESLGLLVEEQRTNLAIYSEDPTQWTASACSLGSPTRLNRYGDGNVSSFLADGTASAHRIIRAVSGSVTANALYSFSFLVAKSSNSDTRLITARLRTAVGGQAVSINVSDDGAASSYSFRSSFPFGASPPAAITSNEMFVSVASDGWTRITLVTAASNANTTLSQWDIGFSPSAAGIELIAGTANTLLFVDQVQIEAGAFPTSYIPTTTATVTRAADVASISNANLLPWFTSFNEHTFYAELRGEPPKGLGGIIMEGLVSGAIGGATLSLNSTSTRFRSQQRTGPSRFDAGNNNGSLLNNTINRVALRASALGSQSGENGLLPTSASAPAQTDWDSGSALSLGKRSSSTSVFLNGCIARFAFWPQSLANSTLQALTQ